MHKSYIDRINAASTVREIIFTVSLASMSRADCDLTTEDWRKVLAVAESRLILDCNVDLTPYSEGDRP